MMDRFCPECASGKHGPRYCAGWTIDDDDKVVDCECACMFDPEEGPAR